jgi:sterol 3beta-glucosyltransferase
VGERSDVCIVAVGSRGDVQPHIALGVGLARVGRRVRVLTSVDFRELVESHGLEFCDAGASTKDVAGQMHDLLEEGNFLKILSSMRESAEQMILETARRGLTACEGADLIVGGLGGFSVGVALAEKLGIPFVPAYLYPFTPTREFPGILTPVPQSALTSWANPLSHRVGQQMMWQTMRSSDNKARAEVLSLPRAKFFGPFSAMSRADTPILYGYSAHVLPVPNDWADNCHVTGYWFLDAHEGWEPPTDLVDFLADGPPPVYVGFGSMGSKKSEQTADMVLDALARSGQRGVLSSGWGGLAKSDLPDGVFMVGSVPHAWLFSQMAAVVHHGGAGTTAAGLRAGVPSVVTPVMGDQGFWGQTVHRLGVGPKPIRRRDLTAGNLGDAIRVATSNKAMCERSAGLGRLIRAEDGVAAAVALVAAGTTK